MAAFCGIMRQIIVKYGKSLAAGIFFAVAGLSLNAQIYVGGPLSENTTWTNNGNYYIVVENVIVPTGITLTIEPGVNVLFELNTSLQVKGTLIARGNPADSITFMPEGDPWGGIYFNGSKTEFDDDGNYVSGSILSYARIDSSSYSIVLQENAGVLIQNSVLKGASFGMYVKDATGNIVRNCLIEGHDFGIFLASSFRVHENLFKDNVIRNNRYVGFFANNSSGFINYNIISENKVEGNLVGLYLGNDGPVDQGFNLVTGNIFRDNSYGIRLFQDTSVIERNYIINNLITGIEIIGAGHSTIRHNLIAGNGFWGMALEQKAQNNHIEGNSIEFNQNGVLITTGKNGVSQYNNFIANGIHNNTDTAVMFRSAPQSIFEKNSIYRNNDSTAFYNLTGIDIEAENNWWGTGDTAVINRFIYDAFDDTASGIVNYYPVLNLPDTAAPIAAPIFAVRKNEFAGTTISWPSNIETDLAGYRVHYGAFDGIHFEHTVDAGADTTIFLQEISASDTLAVTAYDLLADGVLDRPEGHESSFTIAVPGPWAGDNKEICFSEQVYLGDASADDYSALYWSTSGDGEFDDPSLLHATYTPGINDVAAGNVNLTLHAVIEDYIVSDEVVVRILPVPQVYAGADTAIISGTQLQLSSATAAYYSQLQWYTSGDGTFIDENLPSSIYVPGNSDIDSGSVMLVLNAVSECGSSSDTLYLSITPGYSVSGRVHAGENDAAGSILYLYRQSGTGLTPFRSATASDDGSFIFQFLTPGAYCIYSIPPEEYKNGFAPVYFFDELNWENANRLAADANTYDVDINLYPLDFSLPPGLGSISGHCECGSQNPAVCSDVTLLLYDKSGNYLLSWIRPDNLGNFEFSNLPYGEYIIIGEKAGYLKNETSVIALSGEQPTVLDVTVNIIPFKISIAIPGEARNEEPGLAVSPNPTHDNIYIKGLHTEGYLRVKLYNALGKPVNIDGKILYSGNGEMELSLENETAGIYILEIIGDGNEINRLKILKK
jgi:hypothetical protein